MENLQIVPGYDSLEEVSALFREYIDMLVTGEPEFREYLRIQNYDQELENLSQKYGMPAGRFYLAYWDGRLAGCIALRKLDESRCELKRLYVRPAFRGKQIGKRLVERILRDVKEIGYAEILLDTLPFLQRAIGMYRNLGFFEIPSYNDSPLDCTIYMKLKLDEVKA